MIDMQTNIINSNNQNPFDKIRGLIFSERSCMFTCSDAEMNAVSIPIYIGGMDEDGGIYFFLNEEDDMLGCMRQHPKAVIMFSSSPKRIFLRIDCTVAVLLDKSKARQFWNPYLNMFFEKGPEKCLVIKVYMQKVTQWEDCYGKPNVLFTSAAEIKVPSINKHIDKNVNVNQAS